MTELRHPGIWTPWATVVCFDCHGDRFDRGFGEVHKVPAPTFSECCALQPRQGDEGPTKCDTCGRPIWVRDDVAALSEMRHAINLGEMEQTGGMCSGLSITLEDRYVFVSCMDGDWCIGCYPNRESLWEADYDDMAIFPEEEHVKARYYVHELVKRAPWRWDPIAIANFTDCSLADAEEAYATMADRDWIAYCLETFRARHGG